MLDRPAILSDVPVCRPPIRFVRPTLPEYGEIEDEVRQMLASGSLTKGPYLAAFERKVAEHLGVREAVAVSSCTAGLMLTYQALGLKGDAIVPSFTFMATVHALHWNGVRPVFVDVDPEHWTLDAARVEEAITPATSAIIGVHTFGNPCDVQTLGAVGARYGVPGIFDAAHAFGSLLDGEPLGRYGAAEVFSTSATKLLVTGEGGIVATTDERLARQIRIGREYGNRGDYGSEFAGMNARMPEFAAILGLHGLDRLDAAVRRRNQIAERVRQRLGALPGIALQRTRTRGCSSYKDLGILIDEAQFGLTRDALATALWAEGVETRKYFDPPLHRHAMFEATWGAAAGARLHVTERLARQCLNLPIYSDMEDALVDRICDAVERIARHAEAVRARIGAA